MVTVTSALLGVAAGFLLAFGYPWQGGIVAAVSQILDGVDGQLARLTGRSSLTGAFLDSVLDRYADLAMVLGTLFYLLSVPLPYPIVPAAIFVIGFFALVGSAAVSYTTARAAELGLNFGRPTLASKGTRMTVMVLCAVAASVWEPAPLIALAYVAVHANAAVVRRVVTAAKRAR
jgi:phosphatidylglycerophosphate synthase